MDYIYVLRGSVQVTMTMQATNQEQQNKGFIKSFVDKKENQIKRSASRKIEPDIGKIASLP